MANISAPIPNPTQNPSNPFPAWRLPNGTINATETELERASASSERWTWGCGALVVVGVLAELVLAIRHPSYDSFWAIWGSALADLLIGLGVAGEILFSRRDSKCQGELKRRSDERLAQVEVDNGFLEESAAKAMERAAIAEARAAEANLALEKFRSPRVLTSEQWARIGKKTRAFPGTKFSGAVNRADSEFINFISELTFCLIDAGWIGTDWHDPTSRMQSKFPSHLPKIGVGIPLDDVVVTIPMDNHASADGARALVVVLNAEGIAAAPALSTGKDVSIIVGPKR